MTLEQAVAVLNQNRFWGYDTWKIGSEPYGDLPPGSYASPIPHGYSIIAADIIRMAEKHPHDDGRGDPPL